MIDIDFTPVIIIGAGRSGTNILRDSLCKSPEFCTWDCDEINPIWRHGNVKHSSDIFTAEMATPRVVDYIRCKFIEQWKHCGKPAHIVEKTCANSLRVPFISKIFPEAKFIYIVRNGVDVSLSASKRWKGELEVATIPYFYSKIRNTPLIDLPRYLWYFLSSRAGMFMGTANQLSVWGPRIPEFDNLPEDTPLLEKCALQWAKCVAESDSAFSSMDSTRWHKLYYEDFVEKPFDAIKFVHEFLGSTTTVTDIQNSIADVSPKSVNKAMSSGVDITQTVKNVLEPGLRVHKYPM